MNFKGIGNWELLLKKMTWQQLGEIKNKKILDFGSGNGLNADYYANDNDVMAIEPAESMISSRVPENNYKQIQGGLEQLKNYEDESFDIIFCHNVFEYADERKEILKEFTRLLKKDGFISIIKHNRAGRVMQMAVLLNDFEHANELLAGENGQSQNFGIINYYENIDLVKWSDKLKIQKIYGMRTFWDLQQNQEIQSSEIWQKQMLEIENKVSEIDAYRNIAFFHHIILRKG